MPHDAYPTGADLSAYLVSIGLLSTAQAASLDLDARMNAAVAQWERRTGFIPFLAGAATTRYFDPPGPNRRTGRIGLTRGGEARLDLMGGLVGEPSSVITGYSIHSTGSTLTAQDQYCLLPRDNPARSLPYLEIEFISSQWGGPGSIAILGQWGYSTTVPDDVWQALLEYGAWLAVPDVTGLRTRGILEWEDIARVRYGDDPLAHFRKQWRAALDEILSSYQRIVL